MIALLEATGRARWNQEETPAVTWRSTAFQETPLSRVVLIVDDDPLVLDVTASLLDDFGCDVVTAGNGYDALESLSANQRIEILITDINMPGMDGYELAKRAKRMRDGLKVILLSGREREGGDFPLVRKPFLAQDLKRTMAKHTGLC